ncbi:Co2+/Mg2+ efflux protein ApaG [Pseudomethylobacillus aquaticus]|uniref:Protein ApaG n=1 Tax=Pseudomethylobacillus aquaticus TaxID=2676064 RepID=A0A3N0V341_9PROT|nr:MULTISPECIES: Co2+/Mg2+ efflux protein ApaG [Methylophilaceae]ROH86888.1 Co2+/Mg2+ efflux protein ApaG [Pseudomethylobacillus aquaticus]
MPTHKRYEFSVQVETAFLAEQSDVEQNRYAFAYTVTVTNVGTVAAQLISRHWVITDAHDDVNEVRGLGVVGEQPLLKPGEQFQYTSGSVIATPSGTMQGTYYLTAEDGTQFEAAIAQFELTMPRVLH